MKKIVAAGIVLALCLSLLCACKDAAASSASASTAGLSASSSGASSDADAADSAPGLYVNGAKIEADPMMNVNGTDVPFDLYRYYYLSTKYMLSYGDDSLWTGEKGAENTASLLDRTERSVLTHYAIREMADAKGVALSDAELAQIDDVIQSYKDQMGEEQFNAALEQQYYTEEIYRELYANMLLRNKLYGDDILASAAKDYVHVQHILVKFESTEEGADHSKELKKAQEILEKVNAGEDFSSLMEQYNEDTGEPEDGYYFTTGKMVQEFEDAAFALKEGKTSDIVETSYGYHILKRLPLAQSYVKEHLSDFIGEALSAQIAEDLSAYTQKMKVTYSDAYDSVAPDTMR